MKSREREGENKARRRTKEGMEIEREEGREGGRERIYGILKK